jgi:hypothetical protein
MPSDTYILTISDAGVSVPSVGSVTNTSVAADAAIAFSKLASLTSGNVLVGNSSNVPTSVAVTGDVTISNTGVTSIASGAVVNADINASAAIAHSKLASMSSGNILVGSSGSVPTSVAVTGDVTISNAGLTTIANDAVTFGKMQPVSGYSIVGKPTTGTGDIAEISSSSFMLEASTGFLRQADAAAARSTLGITLPLSVANGGTGVTTSTGSGANVLATSPTLITPVLGTPAAGSVLTNCTGLPLTTGVTGILPVANGGTGVTASTGTGENVLASTPTLITPILGTPTSGTLTNCTNLPLTTGVTGSLPAANGGTGQTVYTIGDVLFASTSTALSKLADVATGNALISGGVGVAPSYGKIGLTTHVTGTLPVASGGTGLSTITGYVKGTGTSPLSTSATIPVADISGILPVANGGTGVTALASGFIKSDGTILTSSAAPISIADGGTGVTQSTYGEYYISSITATSIGTTGTFVKVNGTTTAGFLSNFTHPASNRLTYTGTATRKFLVAAALSFHGTGTNDYKFAFHKNTSSLLSPSIISTTGAGAGDLAHVSIQTIVELATNDFIEVFVTNADATNSATIDFMNVTAVALI